MKTPAPFDETKTEAGLPAPTGSAAVNKTDAVLVLICYASAFGLLVVHDWKLAGALVFWQLGKLCKAEAMEEAARRKPPNDPSSPTAGA